MASNGAGASNAKALPNRVRPSWGQPLNEQDYADLALSWISREIADEAMLRRVDDYEGREVVGQKGNRDCSGRLFPYYWPDEPSPHAYRVRRDNPDWKYDKDGKPKPDKKYLGAPGSANRLYIPPWVTQDLILDAAIPIVIVEGEKKALALSRLARNETESLRFVPIALPGVWNWRGKIGKTGGPNGGWLEVKGPIADLSRIEWKNRRVFIVFDSNVNTNASVDWARKGISRLLATRGADVKFVNLPEHCGVNGIDDLLVAWGPARVLELFDLAVSGIKLHVVLPPQFESRPEGMFRVTAKGEQLTQVQLTNYRAAIITNVQLDDGVDTRRECEVEAELFGSPRRFTISASEFTKMDWPIERLGAAAITFPNQREYARVAIQSCSITAVEKCIYTHTGWRNADGEWTFLHAGGGIAVGGAVSDVHVRLLGAIGRYELRSPAGPDALASAIRSSLLLAHLSPRMIGFPLLAATFRSVFGGADFALHLAGETGAFKSELAALHQQHFGSTMNRLHLPGSWSSTGNALEILAFHAKDTLLVIDDFAPHGTTADVARYHAAADRVFRAAGNHAGRGRLDSTAKLREPKPPRALILSTGEDIPRGQSVRARLLILELAKGSINKRHLSECQRSAQEGLYAEAMGGFIQWLAGRWDEAQAALHQNVTKCRAKALTSIGHARTPDIVANLQAGFELYLDFGVVSGVLDTAERDRLANCCWQALAEAAAAQAKHQAATEPTARFLDLLRSSLTSGRAHLQARNGSEPDRNPQSCGWRRDNSGKWAPFGDCIGWVEDDDLYLEPTTAYRVAQIAARDVGDALVISEQTLRKRLRERDLLASVDQNRETLTVRRNINGTSKNVLHFRRSTILPEAQSDQVDDVG